jgi:hypothetical protein
MNLVEWDSPLFAQGCKVEVDDLACHQAVTERNNVREGPPS